MKKTESIRDLSSCLLETSQNAMERCTVWIQEHQNADTLPKGCVKSEAPDPLESEQESHAFTTHSELASLPDSEQAANGSIVSLRKRKCSRDFKDEMSHDDLYSDSTDVSHLKKKKTHCSSFISQEDTEIDTSVISEESWEPRRRAKEVRLVNLTWDLHCGWKDCDFSSSDLTAYVSHVSYHLPEIETRFNEDNEEVYVCLWNLCDFETPNADEVSRHVNFHSFHTKVKCLGRVVSDELNLPPCQLGTDGANLVPDLPNVLLCEWDDCEFTSNNSNNFFNHVKSHALAAPESMTGKLQCKWKGCKAERGKPSKIQEHVRSHTKEKVVACPTCGTLFCQKIKLVEHRQRQLPLDQNKFQCSHCSHYYPTEVILRDHMRHHVNNFKCQFCDMTCPSPWALSMHIRYRHLEERSFACQYCDHRTKTQNDMKSHLRSHMANAPFTCDEEDCEFSCRTLVALRRHYRKVHSSEEAPEYRCHMCNSHYRTGADLTKHLIAKHNFRWPSGHSRFRYKHHEDGFFRLQTVRYESLEIAEDIDKGQGNEASLAPRDNKFMVSLNPAETGHVVANVLVKRQESEEEYVDDPDEQPWNLKSEGGPSMPSLEPDAPLLSRKVLVSIDEVDDSGHVIHSETVEVEQVDADDDKQGGRIIVSDGEHFT